jgi:hypothetical protein
MLNELPSVRPEIPLTIAGLGIIFYSRYAVAGIGEGEDYFSTGFQNPAQVAARAMRGDMQDAEFKLRLRHEVRDVEVCFRDLYDLMDWTAAQHPRS